MIFLQKNAWYFRNALVRANYTNLQKGIHETTEYLEAFLRNLLLNEKNELYNRNLHIGGLLNEEKVDIGDTKVDVESGKVDIRDKKVDIEVYFSKKVVISRQKRRFISIDFLRSLALMRCLEEVQLWSFLS